MTVPADLEYTADQEWVRLRGEMQDIAYGALALRSAEWTSVGRPHWALLPFAVLLCDT